jgi:hypothetical protein
MENITMKTGFDNIFTSNQNLDNSNLDILSLLTVFMENSVSNAVIYTKHSNRTIITAKDISLSLKREVFEFLNSDNLETRAKEILDEYIEELNNSDSEEDEEDEKKIDENTITEETEEFVESTCECDICKQINKYNNIWKDWKPTNKIEKILYDGIIKIDNDFDLN